MEIIYSLKNLFRVKVSCVLENCEVLTGKQWCSEASTLLYSEDGSKTCFRKVGTI